MATAPKVQNTGHLPAIEEGKEVPPNAIAIPIKNEKNPVQFYVPNTIGRFIQAVRSRPNPATTQRRRKNRKQKRKNRKTRKH